jgi:hypothetical protein
MRQWELSLFQYKYFFRRAVNKPSTSKVPFRRWSFRVNPWHHVLIRFKTVNSLLFLEKPLMTYVIEHNHSQIKCLRWTPRAKTFYFHLNARSIKSAIQLYTLAKKSKTSTWNTLISSTVFTSFFSTKLLTLFQDLVSIHKKKNFHSVYTISALTNSASFSKWH